jgi:hypothetical protein
MSYTFEINIILISLSIISIVLLTKKKFPDWIFVGVFVCLFLNRIILLMIRLEKELSIIEKNMLQMEKIVYEYENTCPVIN